MTTALVASALLMHRRGLSIDLLVKRVSFLYEEIQARNGILSSVIVPTQKMVKTYISYLGDFVDKKNEIYEPMFSAKKGESSILMLAYYRNSLAHLFINESEVACALLGLNSLNNQGVSLEQLWEKTSVLK